MILKEYKLSIKQIFHVVLIAESVFIIAQVVRNIALFLLDFNMPRMVGLEFLKKIKSESGIRRIPVIVLTNSEDMADINKIFELGAAGFIKKPDDYLEFVRSIKIVYDYWTLCLQPDYGHGIS